MVVRRGVWIVITLILVAVLVSTAGLVFTGLLIGRQPHITGNSTLVLKIGGDLQEIEPGGVLG
ncbi:MAG: hypothetical protein LC804_25420, partial [Acidobacteria bacterium]|nr:hypothetical protein [Acidobacteriota bacterium]